jgi:hypothetical protein
MTWQKNVSPPNIDRRLDMQEMTQFAYPIELSDNDLDLVAAAGGNNGGSCGCRGGGDNQVGLVNVHTGDINVLDNIAVLSAGFIQSV